MRSRFNNSGGPEQVKLKRGRVVAALFPVFGLLFFFAFFVDYVPPYEAGIKVSKYGGGVAQDVLSGGRWYFTGPGVSVDRFPKAVQALEMTAENSESSEQLNDVTRIAPIEIDTSDGGKVRVDVSTLYRSIDPHAAFVRKGPGRGFEGELIPKATLALKKNLGKLTAEDFYHESHRVERSLAAKDEMNVLLKDIGIVVDHVLIRQYYYEKGYQEQIENRKVQDQLVFTNKAMAEAAKEDPARRKIEAEGKALVEVERQRGDAEVMKIRAEADLYRRKKESEGDMLVKVAEGKGTQAVNQSYASQGSDNLVAQEMAKVLDGIDLIVVSDSKNGVNPLDVESMMRMLGVK